MQRVGGLRTSQASSVQDPWRLRGIERAIVCHAWKPGVLCEVSIVGDCCAVVSQGYQISRGSNMKLLCSAVKKRKLSVVLTLYG